MQNLAFVEGGVNFHKFYPRCFDVCDSIELEDFIEEFKFNFT